MGYTIEISIDLSVHTNVTEVKQELSALALDFDCDHYYYLYDMETASKIPRNHCIMVVNFDDDHISGCAMFLKILRKEKRFHIECIYDDDLVCKLIYASRCYQRQMDKENVVKYNKFKRERSLSDNERQILDLEKSK
jgi:hypothetical protein